MLPGKQINNLKIILIVVLLCLFNQNDEQLPSNRCESDSKLFPNAIYLKFRTQRSEMFAFYETDLKWNNYMNKGFTCSKTA